MTAPPKPRRLLTIALVVVAGAVVFRAALPVVGRMAANYGLGRLDNYVGRIGSVDLSLTRGLFTFNDFELRRRSGRGPNFIEAATIIVDVRMSDLWRGEEIVDVRVEAPSIALIWSPNPESRQLGERLRWAEFFNRLPVQIDRIEIENGFVSLQNLGDVDSRIDIEDIGLAMRGMAVPSGAKGTPEPAQLEFAASVVGEAPITGRGEFVPLLAEFSLTLSSELRDLPLTAANPWFEDFASLDAESGTIHAQAELAFTDPRLAGRLSVGLDGASLVGGDREEGGPLARAWEFVANLGLKVLQDDDDRLEREIPINADVAMPADPDLRQVVLTLFSATVQGIGRPGDDPVRVSPPAGSE